MSNANDTTPHSETMPAMVDPPAVPPPIDLTVKPKRAKPNIPPVFHIPHPQFNPCHACPRWVDSSPLKIGDLMVDASISMAWWKGVKVNNTVCEFRIIYHLARHVGQPITYRVVYDVLKNQPGFIAGYGNDGYRTNVRSAVKRIRKKFVAIDPTFDHIENYLSHGYSWRK